MNSNLKFETDYFSDTVKRNAFIEFIKEIFDLDFDLWDRYNYWDENFKPFSFFEGNKVVANVCLYTLPCLLNGKKTIVTQFSAVGTSMAYRNRGLSKTLYKEAIKSMNEESVMLFLYSSDFAIEFYKKAGYTPVDQNACVINTDSYIDSRPIKPLIELNLESHKIIEDRVKSREPVSDIFSSLSVKLTMFHVLYRFINKLFFIEDLELIIAMERKETRLIIYDLIASKIPSFKDISPYLDLVNIEQVEFRFHTDKLLLDRVQTIQLPLEHLFIMNPHENYKKLIFPAIIQA